MPLGKTSLFSMLVDTFKLSSNWPSKAHIRYFKRLTRKNKKQMAQLKRGDKKLKKALNALKQCTNKYLPREDTCVKWVEEIDEQGNKEIIGRLDNLMDVLEDQAK